MRHDTRRRLIWALGWALSLLLAVAGARILLLMADEELGVQRWAAAEYDNSRAAFDRTTRMNPLDPWIGYFNRGTAHYQLGDFTSAIADFQQALDMAPPSQYCMIALNLSWSWESLGDNQSAGGNQTQAEQSWAHGREVLDGVECGDDSPEGQSGDESTDGDDSGQSPQGQQQETSDRLQDKIDESQQNQPESQDSEQSQQEQLEQRQQEAQSENAQNQGSAPGENTTDRSW